MPKGGEMILHQSTSNWYKLYGCKTCKGELTRDEVIQSSGICPKCGVDSKSTIIDTISTIVREYTKVELKAKYPFIFCSATIERKTP